MRSFCVLLAAIGGFNSAHAADLTVFVKDQRGANVADAVVTFHPSTAASRAEAPAAPLEVGQRDNQFDPFVLIVPKGASVTFANYDDVRHHVFSFSQAKRFNLKLFGKGEQRTVDFETIGAVSIGCNIHDNMIAHLKIVETPFAIRTQADGKAVLKDVPVQNGTLRVWHPNMQTRDGQIAQDIAVAADAQPLSIEVKLRRARQVQERY